LHSFSALLLKSRSAARNENPLQALWIFLKRNDIHGHYIFNCNAFQKELFMPIDVNSFSGQNWAITPVALAVNEAKPASIKEQKWQVVLAGVGIVDFTGNNADDWRRETLRIYPDIISPLQFAINRFGIPKPSVDVGPGLELDQWAPFAAVSSSFSREQGTVDAGFAVDEWRPYPFFKGTDFDGGGFVTQVFQGIAVDIAVRNNQAVLHRVSYHITLIGTIVFPGN
jgi:hypothetical protein